MAWTRFREKRATVTAAVRRKKPRATALRRGGSSAEERYRFWVSRPAGAAVTPIKCVKVTGVIVAVRSAVFILHCYYYDFPTFSTRTRIIKHVSSSVTYARGSLSLSVRFPSKGIYATWRRVQTNDPFPRSPPSIRCCGRINIISTVNYCIRRQLVCFIDTPSVLLLCCALTATFRTSVRISVRKISEFLRKSSLVSRNRAHLVVRLPAKRSGLPPPPRHLFRIKI